MSIALLSKFDSKRQGKSERFCKISGALRIRIARSAKRSREFKEAEVELGRLAAWGGERSILAIELARVPLPASTALKSRIQQCPLAGARQLIVKKNKLDQRRQPFSKSTGKGKLEGWSSFRSHRHLACVPNAGLFSTQLKNTQNLPLAHAQQKSMAKFILVAALWRRAAPRRTNSQHSTRLSRSPPGGFDT